MAILLPEYFWPIMGDETITRETSVLLRQHGPYGLRVLAPTAAFSGNRATDPPQDPIIGSGCVSSPIPVRLEEGFPFVSVQARLWVVGGRVRMELWDVTRCETVIIWPPRYSNKRVVTEEIGNWIENLEYHPGENFFYIHDTLLGGLASEFQIALVAEDADTEFVLDAIQIVNLAEGASTFWEGSASNDLWKAVNDLLRERSILDGVTRYGIEMADLDRLGLTSNEDVQYGADVQISDSRFGITATRRIVEYLKEHLRPADTRIQVNREPKRATKDVAFNPRRDLRLINPEEVNAPATPTGLQSRINVTGQLEITWESAVGANYYQVREAGPGATLEERWSNGRIVEGGERVATTQFIIPSPEPRDYDLMVRAYTESGRPSRNPAEQLGALALPVGTISCPSDLDLALYLAFDEREDVEGEVLRPQQGDLEDPGGLGPGGWGFQPPLAELQRRRRYDQSQYGNHVVCHFESESVANGHPAIVGDPRVQGINPNAPGVSNHAYSMNDGVEDISLHVMQTAEDPNLCPDGQWPLFPDTRGFEDEAARFHRSNSGFNWGGLAADVRIMEQFHLAPSGRYELDPTKRGHFGFDFEDNFSICGWLAPCVVNWDKTWTYPSLGDGQGHQFTLLSRSGYMGMGFAGSETDFRNGNVNLSAGGVERCVLRGWRFGMGGMPWHGGGIQHPEVEAAWYANPNVTAIVFDYLPEHSNPNAQGTGNQLDEDAIPGRNTWALSWPWDYTGGLNLMDPNSQLVQDSDTIQGGGPYCNYLSDDSRLFADGLYMRFTFMALVVSPELEDENGVPNGLCDFTCYAGFVDQGILFNLGTKRAAKMRTGMWQSNLANPVQKAEWIVPNLCEAPFQAYADDHDPGTFGQAWSPQGVFTTGDGGLNYGNNKLSTLPSTQQLRMDEVRAYHRALRSGEVEFLYLHPGGQKRAENTVEASRQVNLP